MVKDRPATIDQIAPLAKLYVESLCEIVENFDDCTGYSRTDPVATESYPGFIPYTDGGHEGVVYAQMSYAHGSGAGPTAVQEDIERSLKDAAEEFERTNDITVTEMDKWEAEQRTLWEQPSLPGVERAPYPPSHPLREELHEAQDSWLDEGGTYFYKARVLFYEPGNSRRDADTPDDEVEVRVFAYLNTDYEYGRDHISWITHYGGTPDQTTDALDRTFTGSEFLALGKDGITKLVHEAVEGLRNL